MDSWAGRIRRYEKKGIKLMNIKDLNMNVSTLGECHIPSPMETRQFVHDEDRILYHQRTEKIRAYLSSGEEPPSFEMAGPGENIYFDPSKLKCGIVTCGGLCPGLNDVIRGIVMGLYYHYGVKTVFGFRYGYEGLTHRYGHTPLELTPDSVNDIHKEGGTILGTSRGPQDIAEMVDVLERMNVRLLFTIGGDGTLRGAQAISEEIASRGIKIGVIGVPKTIDNDISYVDTSFGFETAVSYSRTAVYSAHNEAIGARNGIGLVKLMGRESGFIPAYAALANNDVNFCLIPEVRFSLDVFLKTLVPISLAVSSRKKIDPEGRFWSTILSCIGQPREMT
jgi:6-phosphofructokinase 1